MTTEPHQVATRRQGAGVLLRNDADAVFLVKPSYKDHWEIPGGAVEPGESPRACCDREVLEELGLPIRSGRLLVVDWRPPFDKQPDGPMFVFDGGRFTIDRVAEIVLQPEELVEWRFVPVAELDSYLPDFMARRIRVAQECALSGQTRDLEFGRTPSEKTSSWR